MCGPWLSGLLRDKYFPARYFVPDFMRDYCLFDDLLTDMHSFIGQPCLDFGPVCKFDWCEAIETVVGPVVIVVVPPCFNDVLGLIIA